MKNIIEGMLDRVPKIVKGRVPASLKRGIRAWLLRSRALEPQAPGPRRSQPGEIGSFPGRAYLDRAQYDGKWQELFGARRENYFAMHKRRYYELFNTLAYYRREMKENPLVLEIGVSEFLLFFKHFFPAIRLVTADRPRAQHGFEASFCLERGGAERHYEIDLNRDELSPQFGSPPLGHFDYVICTEVLEHLIVNPVEFLASLLSLLNAGGKLYLTTPNFFRRENLQKISDRVNPLMFYPRKGENLDAHHHFREYSMPELLLFAEEAGGMAIAHYYSDCWDVADPGMPGFIEPLAQRSNLVLVMQKKPS